MDLAVFYTPANWFHRSGAHYGKQGVNHPDDVLDILISWVSKNVKQAEQNLSIEY